MAAEYRALRTMATARRLLHLLIPLVLLAAAVALRLDEPVVVERVRLLVFDTYQRLLPRPYEPGLPVRIVDVDDASLERLGQWPWPRTEVARLVDRLAALGAAAIVLDIVFAEPDRTSPAQVLALWPPSPEVEALRGRLDDLPDHDRILAQAVAGANTVLGFALVARPTPRLPEAKGTFVIAGLDPRPFVPAYPGAVVNLPEIEDAVAGNGAFTTVPDLDNVVRRVPLVFRIGENLYPSIAAEALRVATGGDSYVIKAAGASGVEAFGAHSGIARMKVGGIPVVTDPHGRVLLYSTGSRRERFVSAWQVLAPDFDPALVAGQIVLVGTTAAGLEDLRATPLEPVVAGVEIHAEVIEQIISGT